MAIADEAPRTPFDVVRRFLGAVPVDRPVILVPHSNAGLFVPHIVEQRTVLATVFVDWGLPPEEGSVSLAPPAFLDHLRTLVDDTGLLPNWTAWFDPSDVAYLFPDPETRSVVEAEQRRLPLAYFEATLGIAA